MGMLADYDLIQAVCDGVLIVARQDHTERRPSSSRCWEHPAGKLVGVVVNLRDRLVPVENPQLLRRRKHLEAAGAAT